MIYKNITYVAFFNFFSKILGYIRDFIITFLFGSTIKAEFLIILLELKNIFLVFYHNLSFEKNLVRNYLNKKIKNRHYNFSKNIFLSFLIIISFITIITFLNSEFLFYSLFPGFQDRINFKEIISIVNLVIIFNTFNFIVVFFSSMLQAEKKFLLNSSILLIPNILFLIYLLIFIQLFDSNYIITYYGHFIISVAIFQILLFFLKEKDLIKNLRLYKKFKIIFVDLKYFFNSYFYSFLFLISFTIYRYIEKYFLSYQEGFISFFYISERVANLPVTIIIAAISTVLLPEFASINQKSSKNKINIFSSSIIYCFLFVIYVFVFFNINSETLINLLFGRGEFGIESVLKTSIVLKQKTFGIIFSSIHLILYIFFISQKENKLLLFGSILGLFLSFSYMLTLYLFENYDYFGFNLMIFYLTQIIFLFFYLQKKYFNSLKKKLFENCKFIYTYIPVALLLLFLKTYLNFNGNLLLIISISLTFIHLYLCIKFNYIVNQNLKKYIAL